MRYALLIIWVIVLTGCGSSESKVAKADSTSVGVPVEEQWETYLKEYSGGLGSVLVNISIKEKAPVSSHPYLLITGVKFNNCDGGLPAKGELSALYIISDSVKDVLQGKGNAIAAGIFTHQCKRLDYYYLADTVGVRAALTQMYVLAFPGYEASIHIDLDANWDGYFKFLYPDADAKAYIEDEQVIAQMIQSGDHPEQLRSIEYGIYFKNEEDRLCMIQYADQHGFTIDSKSTVNGEYQYELTISKTSMLDIKLINATGKELKLQAAKCNGDYDGWGAAVVK